MKKVKSPYRSLAEWRNANPTVYYAALKLNIIEELCMSFGWLYQKQEKRGYWSYERCLQLAKTCRTIPEFRANHRRAYKAAQKNGWLKDYYIFLKRGTMAELVKEDLLKAAKQCKTRGEFAKRYPGMYNKACKCKYLDEICSHMIDPRLKWTKKKCLKEAQQFKTKNEWCEASTSSYNAALRHGWFEECTAHMDDVFTYWNHKLVKKESKKYASKSEWQRSSGGSYQYALRHKILEECTGHMNKRGKK